MINNIAWALRHLPVFGVFGSGDYRVQPIYVDDLAELAVTQGRKRTTQVIDAIGPETFTYRVFVQEDRAYRWRASPNHPCPLASDTSSGWILGKILGDLVITWDEVQSRV